ncbi:glycosyltransferase [Paenibacillus sp. FSL H3-0286]|uniref:glycosyltransferase n=1 Tax=Paenibacillus sp. FSL H3-0286 TaxID=2921427 RepID=UPI003249ACD9
MKQRTILYPCTLDWDFLTQRPQQIVKQFAKNGYKVIFCNNTQSNKPPEEVEPNLFVYYNWQDVLNKIKYKQLKIDIYYYTWAKSAQYIEDIKAKLNIYDSVDSFSAWYEYEDQAIESADIVLTSSQFLYEMRSKKHKYVYLIRNACPEDYINRPSIIPDEFKDIDEPIVLFSGAIGSWVDTGLIKKVASKYKTFLVGKEFGKACPSNVINLGTRTHDELYNYYANSDVCLLPFDTSQEVTQAACAIKMIEHMAAGKITVATEWNETNIYPDSVFTGKTDEEFLEQVDRAVILSKSEYHRSKSLEYAKQNTWENRFNDIAEIIENYYSKDGVSV